MNSKFELKEMELEQVAGGRPRIRRGGQRRDPFKIIRDIIDTVRDLTSPKKDNNQNQNNKAA